MSGTLAESRPRFGSWHWVEATNGIMTASERAKSLPSLAATFGAFTSDRVKLALRTVPRHSFGAEELWPTVPDSTFGAEVETEATELQSSAMLHHGYRTWVFGMAFAQIDGASLDSELFYAGALVHDVGLEHIQPARCFTYRSAEAAQLAADRANLPDAQTLDVMDGITMHISPGLEREDSVLGFYLQAGAMADLAGLRAWELPRDLRVRASQTYPRERIHEVVSSCWHSEARAVRGGRAHFADKYGAFSKIVRWFPVA